MRSVQRSTGTCSSIRWPGLNRHSMKRWPVGLFLVEHDLVRQPQVKVERPRFGIDLVGQIQQLEAVDLLALPLPPEQRRGHVPAFLHGLAQRRGVVLERSAFDHQLAVIGQHAQLLPGFDLFARRDGNPLDVK